MKIFPITLHFLSVKYNIKTRRNNLHSTNI